MSDSEDSDLEQQMYLDTTNWYYMAAAGVANLQHRETKNDRPMTGKQWIMHHLEGHHLLCYENYRLSTKHFNILCDELQAKGLDDNGHVLIEEQVAMFLEILGHGIVMRKIGDEFQHSTETVHRYFRKVLDAVLQLQPDYIKTPITSDAPIHPKVAPGTPYGAFKGALGAIDGTHIKAFPDKGEKYPERLRNRKGLRTQNVMGVVDFDGNFLAVVAGWEGSSHDNMILRKAVEDGFVVPTGRYYLVDAGYGNTTKFLAPYRNRMYHLAQFRNQQGRGLGFDCGENLFNYKHSQLRNIIEKTFGILKSRFRILVDMHPFEFKIQSNIVIACCIIHNFINHQKRLDRNPEDDYFEQQLNREAESNNTDDDDDDDGVVPDSTQAGNNFRDRLRDLLWANR